MKKIPRTQCAIDRTKTILPLYTIKKFPISMSCVTHTSDEDVFEDMHWGYSEAGHVQLLEMLDPNLIYKEYHSPGTVGKMWKEHHRTFAEFIKQAKFCNVLEIGGASGSLVDNFVTDDTNFSWTIVEPGTNTKLTDTRIHQINGYFEEVVFDKKFDTIVHSHCFEHVYNPVEFLQKVFNILDYGDYHYISIPNMQYWLANGFTNTLSFEHTFYVDEKVLTHLLHTSGFNVEDTIVGEHSVFIRAAKVAEKVTSPAQDFMYVKDLFTSYIEQLQADVTAITKQVDNRPFYLFGAHIFAQALINMGLQESKIVCILDNDPQKQGKRLYGTECTVASPKCLEDAVNPVVVLRGGSYNAEIKESILNINPYTLFV